MSPIIVCLDLMGTLLADPYRAAIRAATDRPLHDVAARRDPAAWPAFERGEIDERAFAERFFPDGSTFDLATFHRVRRAGYRFLPGMRDLLEELGPRVRCVGATNYPVWVDEVAARFGLARWLEEIWASCRIGVRKPDEAFYRRMLDDLDVEPWECLFIDDREINCDAAERLGMRAHRFSGVEGLRERLHAEGLLDGATELLA